MHVSRNLQFYGFSIFAILSPLLSKYQCKFTQCHNAQCCLLAMIEKWKSSINKGETFSAAYLTELSKVFDWLPRKLLLAKLNAYGLSMATLRLLSNYLRKVK